MMDLRRKIALWIYPELKSDAVMQSNIQRRVKTEVESLINLAEVYAAHNGVTHYAVSMRALGKGDFFKKLIELGADCRTSTAEKLMQWFSDHWPDQELAWPIDIPRPQKTSPQKRKVA